MLGSHFPLILPNVVLVAPVQSKHKLVKVSSGIVFRETALLEQMLEQVAARHVLHDKIDIVLVLHYVL